MAVRILLEKERKSHDFLRFLQRLFQDPNLLSLLFNISFCFCHHLINATLRSADFFECFSFPLCEIVVMRVVKFLKI